MKNPFEYDEAWSNQVGNFDYVSVISDLIIRLIEGNASGLYNVGTELKSMFELAKKTKLDVVPTEDMPHNTTPINMSMNLNKMRGFLT